MAELLASTEDILRASNEMTSLKKQIRLGEAEWKKNKAVLEQRIEILEMQNKELKEREDNLKRMNESVMTAINDFTKDSDVSHAKVIKEIEKSKDLMTKDHSEYKIRMQEQMKNLEKETKEYKVKLNDLEIRYNNSVLKYEKNETCLQQQITHLESEKKNQSVMIKLYEEEKKQMKDKEANEYELHSKIGELRYLVEKQKEDYKKEIEKVHHDYSVTIKNMKKLAESEKKSLQAQIDKLKDSKNDNIIIQDIRKQCNEQIEQLIKERDYTAERNQELEQQAKTCTTAVKKLEDKIAKNKELNASEEMKKLKEKVLEQEKQLRTFNNQEKVLKQELIEKEQKIDENKSEFKKKLINEKKRSEMAQDTAKKLKEDLEKRNSHIIQDNLKKSDQIKKLKQQLTEKENQLKKIGQDNTVDTSKLNNTSINLSMISPDSKSARSTYSKFIGDGKYKVAVKQKGTTPQKTAYKTTDKRLSKQSTYQITEKTTEQTQDLTKEMQNNEKDQQCDNDNQNQTIDSHPDLENVDQCDDDLEEDPKNTTSENILIGLNSPRPFAFPSSNRNQGTGTQKKKQPVTNDVGILHSHRSNSKNPTTSKHSTTPRGKINAYAIDNNESIDLNRRSGTLNGSKKNERYGIAQTSLDNSNKSSELSSARNLEDKQSKGSSNNNNNIVGGAKTMSVNPSMTDFAYKFNDMYENAKKESSNGEEVKSLQGKIRETQQKNEKMMLEKDKLQVELDRVILELKQTKMEWALSEERKEESELALKNEIKFLINKLVQVTNPNSNNVSIINGGGGADVSQIAKNCLNRSNIDIHQSFVNTSGLLNHSQINSPGNFGSFINAPNNVEPGTHMQIINNNLSDVKSTIENNNTYGTDRKPLNTISRNLHEAEFKENKPGITTASKNSSAFDIIRSPKGNTLFGQNNNNPDLLNPKNFEGFSDSPRRVSEFHYNEKQVRMNALKNTNNPKKLIQHIKS